VGLAAASVEALIGKVPAGLLHKRKFERDARGEGHACVSSTTGSNEEKKYGTFRTKTQKNVCNGSDRKFGGEASCCAVLVPCSLSMVEVSAAAAPCKFVVIKRHREHETCRVREGRRQQDAVLASLPLIRQTDMSLWDSSMPGKETKGTKGYKIKTGK